MSTSSWIGFLCCPRKELHSEAEALDEPGGTQLVQITDIARSPSIADKENVVTTSKPGAGLGAATDDPEQTQIAAQAEASDALNSELEHLYEKRIQDLEDELNLVLRRNKETFARVCELEDLMFPEIERTSWVENQPTDRLKEELGKSLKDKRGQERRALKAEENLRDLKHQNAVLQKRLYQAVSLSPGRVPMPPVPPPLPSSTIGPMFSVLRNTTIKLAPAIPQASEEVSGPVQENSTPGDSGSPSGMHEVLEKIRNGVPLRPVTPPRKSAGSLVASVNPKSPTAGSASQFDGTLPEQHVEDTVTMSDGPSTSAVPMPHAYCVLTEAKEMRESPGNLCPLEDMENPGPSRDLGDSSGSGGSTGDEGSTSSTLPLTSNHSEEDDQVTDSDVIELIPGFEVVEDPAKESHHAPCTLGSVDIVHKSDSKMSSIGSHSEGDNEALVRIETPDEHAASYSDTSADRNYLEVEQTTVALSEQISDQTRNEGQAETSFGPTKCITAFSLHVSSKNELDQHFSGSSCDGVNPSSHVNGADTMEKCGISINAATIESQSSNGLNCVPSEDGHHARDFTQANMVVNDNLQADAINEINGKDNASAPKHTETVCNVMAAESQEVNCPTVCGTHSDATSSPKSEDHPVAQTIETYPLIGNVQENELSQNGGKSVAGRTHNIKQSLEDVSLDNSLAVSGSHHVEDCTLADSHIQSGADRDLAESTDSQFF